MTSSRIFQVLLAIIIGFCGYYLLTNQEQTAAQVTPSDEIPQFTGTNVTNTSFDLQGIRNYKITSEQLEHFTESGDTIFDNIVLYVYREGTTEEWQVVSDIGVLNQEHQLVLTGNVVATNLLPDASFDTMTTEKMIIELDSKDFNTDVKVTLIGPQFINVGAAMQGNLDDNEAVLFNSVQGKYEKAQP
jgi:lipopolysaccharide export system protein LptC